MKLTDAIPAAPWREEVTNRDTWPHECVLSERDGQQGLFEAVCQRFRAGEGVACRFFGMDTHYLCIGDRKYWLMTQSPTWPTPGIWTPAATWKPSSWNGTRSGRAMCPERSATRPSSRRPG